MSQVLKSRKRQKNQKSQRKKARTTKEGREGRTYQGDRDRDLDQNHNLDQEKDLKSQKFSGSKTSTTDIRPIIRRAHRVGSDLYLIRRPPDESLDVYYKRIGYITRKMKKGLVLTAISNNSIIWRNYQIYGMSYPSTVLRRL